MDEVIKSKEKLRQREIKYRISFTNTAIDNLKHKGQTDKGQFIKVRFKDQRDLGKTEAEAIEDVVKNVTGHEGKGETIKHHYYKPSFKKELKRAKDTAKVMAFKTKN